MPLEVGVKMKKILLSVVLLFTGYVIAIRASKRRIYSRTSAEDPDFYEPYGM
jgi:hypothetical protein